MDLCGQLPTHAWTTVCTDKRTRVTQRAQQKDCYFHSCRVFQAFHGQNFTFPVQIVTQITPARRRIETSLIPSRRRPHAECGAIPTTLLSQGCSRWPENAFCLEREAATGSVIMRGSVPISKPTSLNAPADYAPVNTHSALSRNDGIKALLPSFFLTKWAALSCTSKCCSSSLDKSGLLNVLSSPDLSCQLGCSLGY